MRQRNGKRRGNNRRNKHGLKMAQLRVLLNFWSQRGDQPEIPQTIQRYQLKSTFSHRRIKGPPKNPMSDPKLDDDFPETIPQRHPKSLLLNHGQFYRSTPKTTGISGGESCRQETGNGLGGVNWFAL